MRSPVIRPPIDYQFKYDTEQSEPVAFDTPVDAWYVWIGVVLVSGVALGITLELPTEQQPDAAKLVETVEYVGATGDGTAATVELTADEFRTDGTTVELRRGDEISRKTLRSGIVIPVAGAKTETGEDLLERLLTDPAAKANYPQPVIEEQITRVMNRPRALHDEWYPIDDKIRLRAVTVSEKTVVLLGT